MKIFLCLAAVFFLALSLSQGAKAGIVGVKTTDFCYQKLTGSYDYKIYQSCVYYKKLSQQECLANLMRTNSYSDYKNCLNAKSSKSGKFYIGQISNNKAKQVNFAVTSAKAKSFNVVGATTAQKNFKSVQYTLSTKIGKNCNLQVDHSKNSWRWTLTCGNN